MSDTVETFNERVRRLADERGLSLEKLGYAAWNPQERGASPSQLKQVLAGRRTLKPGLIAAIAHALEVDPRDFPEYRLAEARRLLDEREVGLPTALANLERIEAATELTDPGAEHERELQEEPQPSRRRADSSE